MFCGGPARSTSEIGQEGGGGGGEDGRGGVGKVGNPSQDGARSSSREVSQM